MQRKWDRAALAVAGGVLCAALAVLYVAQSGVEGFIPSLNLASPPLAAVSPVEDTPGAPLSRKVVLIILDGLGASETSDLPHLDALRARGVDATARSHFPTLSRPNYVAILTGVEPALSGVRTNDYDQAVPLDGLVARVAAAGRRSVYIADESPSLPTLMPGWDDVRIVPWPDQRRDASRAAIAGDAALVVFLLDDVDHAGHRTGAASPEYRRAVRGYDGLLGDLVAHLDLERDTVIVTADHGHTARGGHGGLEPEVVNVPLVLAGAGIARGAQAVDAELRDVAPTVATLLGLPTPGHAVGRTLVEVLALDPQARAARSDADALRRARLHAAVAPPLAAILRRAGEVASRRLEVVVAVALLIGLLVLALRRARLVVAHRTVVVAAALSLLVNACGLLLCFSDCIFSPSVPGATIPFGRYVVYGAGLAVVHCALAWMVTPRTDARRHLAATLGVASISVLLAAIITGAGGMLAGMPLAARFFGPTAMVLLPTLLAAGLFHAAASACVVMVEMVVFVRVRT